MKSCKRCGGVDVPFNVDKSKKDNMSIYCSVCTREKTSLAHKSKFGLVNGIYSNQKLNSKKRGHTPPLYSVKELREWLYDNKKYHLLYTQWVESEYDKLLTPSCDRIDDSLGYDFDNITVMTWGENRAKGYRDVRSKKLHNPSLLNGGHSPIDKMSKDGDFIRSYISQAEAARDNNVHQANIHKCLTMRHPILKGVLCLKR